MRALVCLLMSFGLSAPSFADERSAVEAAAQAWTKALNARDIDALMSMTTEDVVLIDAGDAPISGRKAAREALVQATRGGGQLTTATKEAVTNGDIAWRIGAFTRKLQNGDVSHGQSLEIWERAHGMWKLRRQMSANILSHSKMLGRPPLNEPVLDTPRN